MSLKKAKDYLGNDLQVDSAIKDAKGQVIHQTYQKKGEISYPTVTITLAQVISADPLEIQLTNEQYNVLANNKQVIIDITALDPTSPVVVWEYSKQDSDYIYFGFADLSMSNNYYEIMIDKTTKEARYEYGQKQIAVDAIGGGVIANAGKLLGFDSSGWGVATNNLPILTTAPTNANTEGGLIIVVLSSEPATYYNGYYYIITESNS